MISLFDRYILSIVEHLKNMSQQDYYQNMKLYWRVFQVVGPELTLSRFKSYSERKLLDFGMQFLKRFAGGTATKNLADRIA